MIALTLSLRRKRKVGVAAFSLLGALAAGTVGMRTAKAADPSRRVRSQSLRALGKGQRMVHPR